MKYLSLAALLALLAVPASAETMKNKKTDTTGSTNQMMMQNDPNDEDSVNKGDQRLVPDYQRGSNNSTGGPAKELNRNR